jgi:hypothetical protein
MATDDILSVKYYARSLSDQALLAHYTENTNAEDYRVRQMHKEFLMIADLMGYDVQLRSAETEDEAA